MNNKKETIKKLWKLKTELPNMTYLNIYHELQDICYQFDCNDDEGLYLEDSMHNIYDFIEDDERLQYIVEEEAKNGIFRLKNFINTIQNNDIWYIDAYGNLEDVTDDTFINTIDELIEKLEG